ncbi:MAG: hypothetical protein HC878_11420 [Leptolyngbyaceae cyanobacterium SL_5_14]|nr:hypothetical protein [Leptolyngbyaceae cyanobacterium SL_5_14]
MRRWAGQWAGRAGQIQSETGQAEAHPTLQREWGRSVWADVGRITAHPNSKPQLSSIPTKAQRGRMRREAVGRDRR